MHRKLRKRKNFLVFGGPLIERPEIEEVVATMKSGWLGTGPRVNKFEQMFCKFKGCKYAIALNSCTAALHLAMRAIDIKPNDEVLVSAMTFVSTANAILHSGGTPVIVDCCKDTMNIDPEDVKRKITKRTKAIIPVHFAGRPCAMDKVMKIARDHGLKVIEDCAHAISSVYHGKQTGNIGDIGCYSFDVTKNITSGQGGMAITGNLAYDQKIKILALQGMTQDAWGRFDEHEYKFYDVIYDGYKYNMMDLQAAIGIHQLSRILEYRKRREAIWQRYNQAFIDLPAATPCPVEAGTTHAYHLYTLMLDLDRLNITREQFLDRMIQSNIGVGVHYTALHLYSFYRKKLGAKRGDFPNAEWISDRTVSLPISPKLTAEDVEDVINAVRSILIPNMKR